MEVVIASDQERENLSAEIHVQDQPWAEIILNPSTGRFDLTIFPSEPGGTMTFDLREVEKAISEARAALAARGYTER
jgi:hypothetical protein